MSRIQIVRNNSQAFVFSVHLFESVRNGRLLAALLLALIFATLLASPSMAAEHPIISGPREIMISYKCDPANRPAFRRYLEAAEMTKLAEMKRKGGLHSYKILFNPFITPDTWDAMLVLDFAKFADTRNWLEVERTQPGGLSPAGLKLATPIATYSSDLVWDDALPDAGDDSKSIYYVIPYDYNSEKDYMSYIGGYVIPQVQGWMQSGVLSSYKIFMNRYPAGKPWDSLFLFQYRDLDAFGRRATVMADVRAKLVADPTWSRFNEIKQTIRTESENTIAESLQPR
jgi:hypothetical protein